MDSISLKLFVPLAGDSLQRVMLLDRQKKLLLYLLFH